VKSQTVIWEGPFAWPGYEQLNGLPTLPEYSGVYLQAFDYDGGFAIWGPGITARPFYKRFREHTRGYLNGDYTVLDSDAVQQRGERREVWHGWGEARKRRAEFEERRGEITEAVHRMLAAMRIFVADVGPDNRVARRMEAGVTDLLYSQSEPLSLLPDRGTSLSRRWPNEEVILVESRSKKILHGIPSPFEI
jgi:hypothetical protein